MKIFLWIFSALWIVVGLTAIISPERVKKIYIDFVKPVKWMSIIPIIAGLLFLWAAPASRLGWLIKLFGILGLIKGAVFLLLPVKALKATLDWWLDMPSKVYRAYGVFALLLAWVVIWSIL